MTLLYVFASELLFFRLLYTLFLFFPRPPTSLKRSSDFGMQEKKKGKSFSTFFLASSWKLSHDQQQQQPLDSSRTIFFLVWLSKSFFFYDSLTRSHALNSLDSKRLDSFFFFNKFYLRIGNLIIGKEKGALQLFQEWPHRHPSLGSFVRVCVCVKQEFEYLPKTMLQLH